MPREIYYYSNRGVKTIDQFSSRTLLSMVGARKEYKVNDAWQDQPPLQKPEDTRMVIPTLGAYKKGREVYHTWEQLQEIRVKDKPVFPEKILQRMLTANSIDPLVLFVPWGVRINGEFGAKEDAAMNNIDTVRDLLAGNDIESRVLLMPADIYAVDINGMPADKTSSYFNTVGREAQQRGYEVAGWSEIRETYGEDYDQLAAQFPDTALINMFSPYILEGALKAAGRKSNTQPETAAFNYLRERVCEAEIIERRFSPVKLSMVDKRKDNEVDRSLPRLYTLDEQLKFPWL